MSDYEIIMLLLQKGHFLIFFQFRDAPDVTTRLTIFLYYSKVIIYRQIMMNTCMEYSLMMVL